MTLASLTTDLKAEARRLGFDLCGVCPAAAPPGVDRFSEWLAAGYAGQMHYLPDRAEAAADPQFVLDGARSIVMLAMNYRTADAQPPQPGQGRVSRYAWGGDYHDLIRSRLRSLAIGCATVVRRPKCAALLTPRRYWNESSRNWPGWVGSVRTRCF